jgi:NAD(P)-dependent dehydrogenase (short-subunit alcohol dehydrogenase family)
MDMAQTALDAFGHIDALVNNAALYGGLKVAVSIRSAKPTGMPR